MRPLALLFLLAVASVGHAETKPLKALLVAGGCCHDYAKQHVILSQGIQARANVQVDVVWTDDKSVTPPLPLYDNPDWAKGYDIIIHDECAAGVKDMALVKRILDVHKTVPAVHLHCAMHSFRTGKDVWFKHLGIQSASHGPQEPIAITFVDKEHPITKPLADWTTIKEELYNNVNIFDGHPLAMGKQVVKGKDVDYVVAWTNEKQGARSFSTTIGHNNDTVADARYLDLVTRGVLWAMDKLTPDYLTPFKGENKITFVAAKPVAAPKPPVLPKDGLPVKASASSEEKGKGNYAWKAVDGDEGTRWCAANQNYPQWLQLELEKPETLTGIKTTWENAGVYQFKVEGSTDGKTWSTLVDGSDNTKTAPYSNDFAKVEGIRFVKIHALAKTSGGWASIREVQLKGPNIKAVAPKLSEDQKKEYDKASDPLKDAGNIVPKIVKLTPEQEAAILKDVKVADGFDVSLFANSAAANYPVFLAAEPDGTLYVSSDGDGSVERKPNRGRIIRLRDLDGDGRADETKVFCEVDSPRGLVWDHDRLYVVHPPHLSEFIDADHDGVAEKENILVNGIAFGFKDRPADHTTNGLSLGIDGWLYIAGGDFGFMDAVGTDGKHLQHRGGGVIRVRPDGTGLEIYSTGTRNILEVAISPLMDMFARDNTNDGGGWNVRFHHFTGLDNHGYPRLYKNFNDECIQPLADYGGGSGTGAVYIDEPGFGEWNNAPFTCDWGTGALWHHQVKPKGATFEETRKPEPFIKMTRPTDADVDGMSRVYCASWKGATFGWAGPDVGYIVQVKPKGFKAEPLPDFAKAKDAELVKALESVSYRRRIEAQREIMRRLKPDGERRNQIGDLVSSVVLDTKQALQTRIAAAFSAHGLAKVPVSDDAFFSLALRYLETIPYQSSSRKGKSTRVFASVVGLGDFVDSEGSQTHRTADHALELASLSSDPRVRREAARLPGKLSLRGYKIMGRDEERELRSGYFKYTLKLLGDIDPVVRLTAIDAFGKCMEPEDNQALESHHNAGKLVIPMLLKSLEDSSRSTLFTESVLRALAKIHQPEVVTGLTSRLGKATEPALRNGILAALCRLHFQEGEWKGDSWGTRPDTRGPYYQPEAWSETPKIAAALKEALAKASAEEAAFLVKEMNRNRIQFNEALVRILELAKQDEKVIPDAVAQLATAETIPADAVPLLVAAVKAAEKGGDSVSPVTLSKAIIALTKTDSAEGVSATLAAFHFLKHAKDATKEFDDARNAFMGAPKLENHHQLIEDAAVQQLGKPVGIWADAALVSLSTRKSGAPESRELSAKALDAGWQIPQRRIQIITGAGEVKSLAYADKIIAALDDPDKDVAAQAKIIAGRMKLEKKAKDTSPLISSLKPEEALAAVIKTKGDIAIGEQIFTKATCIACHTTKESEAQKGPYLGNIAQTYKRPDLAQNILDPNKTIAQGFVTEVVTLNDGTQQMGFITLESADSVKLRNVAAQEFTFAVKDIKSRQKLPISIMPPGLMTNFTVREFASLLDYLESLAKK
jgi:putative membrane-bound dehydrogenase-like protein